jgi:sorbitol-specific phosphotransferase system component IIC
MMVLVARFAGIADLAALIGVFALTTSMILFGLLMERQQRPGTADWSAFWFGSLAGVVPWIAVAVYVVNGASPPGFVYAIVAVQFVFFFSFALNMALQYLEVGRWRDYRFGEAVYMLLSLGAKSVLAWLVFANVLRS